MNVLKKSIILGGCVAALSLAAGNNLMAQGRGNFDPAQFKQMRIDRAHEQLEITNDVEWKAIEPLVSKVVDAEGEVMRARAVAATVAIAAAMKARTATAINRAASARVPLANRARPSPRCKRPSKTRPQPPM